MAAKLYIAGIGAGDERLMTQQLREAIAGSDLVLGAKRMTQGITDRETAAAYTYVDIKPYLTSGKYETVTVLMSGDSGFYSGAKNLYKRISEDAELADWAVDILPGISSISYFAAKCRESYDDAAVYSMHGKETYEWKAPLVDAVRYNSKVFTLSTDSEQIHEMLESLGEYFGSGLEIILGYQLSYPDEQIIKVPSDIDDLSLNNGLYVALIKNNNPDNRRAGSGIKDSEFIRGKVPMTKQEVRHISIDKLGLYSGAILYDIGCGTGSVAIEAALCDPTISVFAVDKNPEAIKLTEENAIIHKAANVEAYCEDALEFLQSQDFLLAPTHAFIGGSNGKLRQIVEQLYLLNDDITIVINAVTLDTIAEVYELMTADSECIYMSISRNELVGSHQMMKAENQVAIVRL